MQPAYLIALFAASAIAVPVRSGGEAKVSSPAGSYFQTITVYEGDEAEVPETQPVAELKARDSVRITTTTTETHTFRSGTKDEAVVILTTTDERIVTPDYSEIKKSPLFTPSPMGKYASLSSSSTSSASDKHCYFYIFCGLSRKIFSSPLSNSQEIIAEQDMLY